MKPKRYLTCRVRKVKGASPRDTRSNCTCSAYYKGEEMKKDRIDLRIDPKDKEALKKKAKKEGRSLSNFIIWKCKGGEK